MESSRRKASGAGLRHGLMREFLESASLVNRNYRYTWMGQVVSEIGDNFNNIAVFALAMALTHSGLVVMGVMLSRAIPAITIGPLGRRAARPL
jgi:hypothetical protein